MTTSKIDNSRRIAAKVAGWSGLLTVAIVVFGNYVLLDNYYVGLPFFGLAATVCAWLWLKSNYVPIGLFELALSVWLLTKGLKPAASDQVQAGVV